MRSASGRRRPSSSAPPNGLNRQAAKTPRKNAMPSTTSRKPGGLTPLGCGCGLALVVALLLLLASLSLLCEPISAQSGLPSGTGILPVDPIPQAQDAPATLARATGARAPSPAPNVPAVPLTSHPRLSAPIRGAVSPSFPVRLIFYHPREAGRSWAFWSHTRTGTLVRPGVASCTVAHWREWGGAWLYLDGIGLCHVEAQMWLVESVIEENRDPDVEGDDE